MRQTMTLLGVSLVVFLAAVAAQADWLALTNWSNGNGDGTGPDWTLPNGPHATTDGALWIENTPGSPALVNTAINMQFKILGSSGWMSFTYLIGSTNDTVTYPGYFNTGDTNAGFGVTTGLSGSTSCEILAWTGSYSTYAAAVTGHAKVADSGVFTNPVAHLAPGSGLTNMPAVVLKAVPEPSTLLLSLAGLLGLAIHAWRRRMVRLNRFVVVLAGVAILAFSAANRPAAAYQFEPDNYFNACGEYPQIPNDTPGSYYLTLPNGPTATVDGAIWLNTGSGPALKSGNLAVSIYYKNTSSVWQLEETMFCGDGGYAGYFYATVDPTWGMSRNIANPLIVGSETIPTVGEGNQTFTQGLFYAQFWSDPTLLSTGTSAYGTYAQAFAASAAGASRVYVAQTVPFKVDFPGGMIPLCADNTLGMYMPAVVLAKAVPEPSTIALALAGLLGLTVYAWRKRK